MVMRESWSSSCSSQEKKVCVEWVEKYFKDCLCNLSSEISFSLGLVSLFFWGIAEIPQIITNFHSKSAHGVSLALLFTWVLGDIFNLVGCLLEPFTLYTSTTVVLLVQTIYYDYWLKWWKNKGLKDDKEVDVARRKHYVNADLEESRKPLIVLNNTLSIRSSPKTDIYYMSARSLASSWTPPYGSSSYLVAPRSGPSSTLGHDSSSEDESNQPTSRGRTRTKPMSIPSRSGLNPLMFIFALVANATYVGSILARSIEWERIKANAPWLLDAIVCVLLDLFIIIQFAYYKSMQRRSTCHEDEDEISTTVKKPLI
ncbi:hypothetical protein J5N97_024607 [Dioscorea zingiberensis]|uniref:Uncharacterized protein n=1 Tax=Dioscorea zingiberensis TaxID=325984 RepID=A0A9D5C7N4_9LILI|nr:hypothetical protein J5N97_024607 [Dioscorea zingiberensis]